MSTFADALDNHNEVQHPKLIKWISVGKTY